MYIYAERQSRSVVCNLFVEDELTIRPTTGEKGFTDLFILQPGCRSAQSYVTTCCHGPVLPSVMNSCVAGTSTSRFGSDC